MLGFCRSIKIPTIFYLLITFSGNVNAYSVTEKFYECYWLQNFECDVRRDFRVYFETDNLLQFGNFLLVAGILANTGLDRSIHRLWQEDIRSNGTNNFFRVPEKIGGLSFFYIPIYLSAMSLGYFGSNNCLDSDCMPKQCIGNVVYQWGYRSIRAFILGGLQQVVLASVLGSGRPSSGQDSKWQPFRYRTGVSGHAFNGALPFITAAMMTDPPIVRFALYAASTLPGISRINSDAHYTSQVLLGWVLAYFSARAVYESDQFRQMEFQVGAYPKYDGMMVGIHYQF